MRLIFFIFLISFSGQLVGQGLVEAIDPNMMNSDATLYAKKYNSINGTPYLEKEMFKGDVSLESGKVFKDEMINLDLVSHALLIQIKSAVSEVDSRAIASFTKWGLKGTEVYEKILYNGKPHFARLVHTSDNFKVYFLKVKQVVRKSVQSSSYNDENSTNDFFSEEEFFVATEGNDIMLTMENSKNAWKDLDHADELKKYIKNNNLKFKDEADFVKLISYYHTIN